MAAVEPGVLERNVTVKRVFISLVIAVSISMLVTTVRWLSLTNKTPLKNALPTDKPQTQCEIPASGFKGWNEGVVTTLEPEVIRNCTKIYKGDEQEIASVHANNLKWNNSLADEELLQRSLNCTWVREYFTDNLYMTKLEREFPIAYTFVIHNGIQQVLRLLRLLYRPTNTYCIHPDKKSPKTFTDFFHNIAGCLKNVIIPQQTVNITYGLYTIMAAQMSCLEDLMELRSGQPEREKWNYVINLCGKELPLASTHSIVSHLIKLNGSSAIHAKKVNPTDRKTLKRFTTRKVPFDIPLYKSMTYIAMSHTFADYLLNNSTALQLYDFFKQNKNSEEHYYATLYMIPGVPGGFNPNLPKGTYFDVMKCIWLNYDKHPPCSGLNVHNVCVVTVRELRAIVRRSRAWSEGRNDETGLFHNKYWMEVDHTIMDCMEERLVAENKREYRLDCDGSNIIT